MRWIRLVALLICAVPLALVTSGPLHPQAAARPNLGEREPGIGRDGAPYTSEEWNKVSMWMSVNCPNRLKFIDHMENGSMKEHAKQLIVERYRQIEHTAYKPLADAFLNEAQAQDQIFGAQIRLRDARRGKEVPERVAARADLRKAVNKLIDAELQEKGARITHLQGEIEHLQKNRNTLVEEWSKGMMRRVGLSGDGSTPTTPDTESTSPGESGLDVPQ